MTTDLDEAPATHLKAGVISRLLKRYKWIFFFAGLTWLGLLLAGGIVLSTVDARAGLHVFGSKTWVVGQTVVLRVGLKDLQYGMKKPLDSVQVHIQDTHGNTRELHTITQRIGQFVQGVIRVPEEAGDWHVEFRTHAVETPLLAKIKVKVLAAAPSEELPPGQFAPKKKARDTGAIRLDIWPTDGSLPGELNSSLTLTASRDGRPVAGEVALKVNRGESKPRLKGLVSVPPSGFAQIPIHSIRPYWEFSLSMQNNTAIREFSPVATQFTIQTDHPTVTPGLLPFKVRSVFETGETFVDLYWGDRWLTSTGGSLSAHTLSGKIEIPDFLPDNAILWLRAYANTYEPGNNRGGRHLLVDRKDDHTVVHTLAQKLAEKKYGPSSVLNAMAASGNTGVRALLGQLPWPQLDPPLLVDSGVTVRQTVNEMKRIWQNRFVTAFLASGFLIMIVILVLLYQNQKQVREGWAEFGDPTIDTQGTRKRATLDAAYVLLILGLFMYGLTQLVTTLRW